VVVPAATRPVLRPVSSNGTTMEAVPGVEAGPWMCAPGLPAIGAGRFVATTRRLMALTS